MNNNAVHKVSIFDAKAKEKLTGIKFTEKGQKIRIAFLPDPESTDGNALLYMVEYFPYNEKYKLGCKVTGIEAVDKLLETKLGKPTFKYVAPVVVYTTKPDGSAATWDWQIKPFVISANRIGQFKSIATEWGGLTSMDIVLTCKNTEFQDFDATPTPTRVLDVGIRDGHINNSELDEAIRNLDVDAYTNIIAYDADPAVLQDKLGIPATLFGVTPETCETPDSTPNSSTPSSEVPSETPTGMINGMPPSDELPADINKLAGELVD